MFIVTLDAGYNLFFLNARGNWGAAREAAAIFTTRAAANIARRRAYKTRRDTTAIEAA